MAKQTGFEKRASIVMKALKGLDLKLLNIDLDGINLDRDVTANSVRKLAENDDVVEFIQKYSKESHKYQQVNNNGFPKAPEKFSSFQYKKEVEKYISNYIDFHNPTLSGKMHFLFAAYCLLNGEKKSN